MLLQYPVFDEQFPPKQHVPPNWKVPEPFRLPEPTETLWSTKTVPPPLMVKSVLLPVVKFPFTSISPFTCILAPLVNVRLPFITTLPPPFIVHDTLLSNTASPVMVKVPLTLITGLLPNMCNCATVSDALPFTCIVLSPFPIRLP